jgi:hypothetical protein
MSELEPVIPQGERQLPLEPQPREFKADDVVNIQRYMQELQISSLSDSADYVPSKTGLYDHLTEADTVIEQEPRADESSFDKSVSSLLSAWGERMGLPPEGPKTLKETKDLFAQNPKLNDTSPIHFQGGAEYVTSRFTHVITGRALGKHREPTARRYYLNPKADKMGHVVEQLTGAALLSEVPLYFKFVDVATGNPDRRTLSRTDRIVIYASEGQTEFVEGLIGHVAEESPDAFSGRKVAGFGEILADGITMADEVTDEQNERFKGYSEGTSFNDLRSQLLYEATLDVTKDLVSIPEFASVKVGGQTVREVFASELSKAMSEYKTGTVIRVDDPELTQALEVGLSAERLKVSGEFSENAVRAIKYAVARTARNVLPRIQPDSLLRGYQYHIKQLAPKYGIDPNNLARNIPIAA